MVLHSPDQQADSTTPRRLSDAHGGVIDPDSATLQLGLNAAPTLIHSDVTFDNAQATWDVLAQHLEAFLTAWEREATPAIANHLPAQPPVLRKLALVELIKVDMEHRFARDAGRVLEDYVREFPELEEPAGPPCELIYEEFHVRNSHGHGLTAEDYFLRFPGRRHELSRLLGVPRTITTGGLIASRPPQLQEGDKIDDFDLLARLGKGAFGTVFLARQRSINRLVALKISPDRGQETRTLAMLDHPHIVRVYDERRMPEQKLRLVYMQFAAGGTLADVVARIREVPAHERSGKHLVEVVTQSGEQAGLGPMADPNLLRSLSQLSWPEVICRLGTQLALALDHAHRQGVLHRDVKPANILLGADASPKLADFNISANSAHPTAGAAAYFGGSLAYMSPEHLEAFNPEHTRQPDELDNRADLYSLAVVLWELLTGDKPFLDTKVENDWGKTLAAMTDRRNARQYSTAGISPHESFRNVLEVLERALSPDRSERPANGAELAHELHICAQAQTRRLVRLPRRGWREWVRRFPVLAVLLVVTVPNVLAGVFNYFYNYYAIINHDDKLREVFDPVMNTINGIAFPLGAFLVLWTVWPVARKVKQPDRLRQASPEALADLRRYALRLGHRAAIIGLIEWIIAGILYPVLLHRFAHQLEPQAYPHFLISLALCGLVAAAYPFLGVTFLSVRVLLPALLTRGTIDPTLEVDLRRIGRQAGVYFLIACGVPLVGLALIVMSSGQDNWNGWKEIILGSLALISLSGLAVAFKTYSVILRDIESLIPVLRPVESFGLESTSGTR